MNYPNFPVNVVVWIGMALLFLIILVQSIAAARIANAKPKLRYADKYSKPFTFWVYETHNSKMKDIQLNVDFSERALLSTANLSIVSVKRPDWKQRGKEIHNIAIILIENPNITDYAGVTANKVGANVTCFREDSKKQVPTFDARWWDEIESDLYVGDESLKHLSYTTIAPGKKSHLAIAEQLKGDDTLYAYNAESHHFEGLRKKEFEMGKGKFYARIQLSAEGIIPPKPIGIALKANKKEDRIDIVFEEPEWAKRLKE